MNIRFKILASVVAALNIFYLAWLIFNVSGFFGWFLLVAEAMIASLTFLFIVNHWNQKHIEHKHIEATGNLDVFLTVVNEPASMFKETLRAASAIGHKNKTVYVLDDGRREEIKNLAVQYGATYLARPDRSDSKAGNLNFGLSYADGDYVLVLDADQVVTNSKIGHDILHYFAEDPKLAMVTTRQKFNTPEKDFNHDMLFYEHMQSGKNNDNAAISCGSGVFYRRSALDDIGGFQTWNIVEDLYTSYVFHRRGYKTLYINRSYTEGTAPLDLYNIYKQRGTWALDTFRLFFRKSPLFASGLSIKQRLHYTEIAWAYIVSAFAIPVLFLLPPLALLLKISIISDGTIYLIFRIPSLAAILYFYYRLSGNSSSIGQFWASLSFVYLKAFFLSLLPVRTKYKVTDKLAGPNKRDISLVIPHIFFILFGLSAIMFRFYADQMITPFWVINTMWITLMIFWFTPVIKKGFLLE